MGVAAAGPGISSAGMCVVVMFVTLASLLALWWVQYWHQCGSRIGPHSQLAADCCLICCWSVGCISKFGAWHSFVVRGLLHVHCSCVHHDQGMKSLLTLFRTHSGRGVGPFGLSRCLIPRVLHVMGYWQRYVCVCVCFIAAVLRWACVLFACVCPEHIYNKHCNN